VAGTACTAPDMEQRSEASQTQYQEALDALLEACRPKAGTSQGSTSRGLPSANGTGGRGGNHYGAAPLLASSLGCRTRYRGPAHDGTYLGRRAAADVPETTARAWQWP